MVIEVGGDRLNDRKCGMFKHHHSYKNLLISNFGYTSPRQFDDLIPLQMESIQFLSWHSITAHCSLGHVQSTITQFEVEITTSQGYLHSI